MTLLTALELESNYPDNILIVARQSPSGKYAGFCYLLKDGDIHKLMLSSVDAFDSAEKAEEYMHNQAKEAKLYVNK